MFCPRCGTCLSDDSRFCSACGYAIPGTQPQQPQTFAAGPAPQQPQTFAAGPAPQQPQTFAAGPAPQQPQQQPAPAEPSPKRRTKLIAGIAAAAAVVVVAAVAIAISLSAPPDDSAGSNDSTGPTVNVEESQTGVASLERPKLVTSGSTHQVTIKPSVASYSLTTGLGNVYRWDNRAYPDELTNLLQENGFAVMAGTGNYEFHEIYESNRYSYVPSFVTVDSMMHAYHLYYQHLQKNTERNYLSAELLDLSRAMLAQSEAQYDALKGTEWEDAALHNVAFFAVGASLLDPSTEVPAEVSQTVESELANINQANGIADSTLIGDKEDYSQYTPRSYYAGEPDLEAYFRAMMWYGRINFKQSDEQTDRSALLMTLALRDAAYDEWEAIYAITSFFAGESDDCGYCEYYPLVQEAYGDDVTEETIVGDNAGWERYHSLTAQVRAPQINSVIVQDEGTDVDHLEAEKGFRLMGQRFSIDASIMQQLVYNKVGENSSNQKRMLPNALDVPAAIGSDEALSILEDEGATAYDGYSENMQELRANLGEQNTDLWQSSLASQWLYTLNPLLEEKGEGYPEFMQSKEWTRKNLQSYLGSYTELKHDSILYAKQVVAEMGGGGMDTRDDRGYVEPEPEVYARLADLVEATSSGLERYGMLSETDAENMALLQSMAEQLQTISEKELQEQALTDEEYEFIRSYGGNLEHFWVEVYQDDAEKGALRTMNFPAALVADVATNADGGTCLELGTGKASTIYVVVPVDGELRLTRGSVYSFYQFEQPISQRLTDQEWREMLHSWIYDNPDDPNRVHVESWTSGFQVEK